MKDRLKFEDFYKEHIVGLTNYIASRVNGDYHLAEEIADDVMCNFNDHYSSVMVVEDEAIWRYLKTTADRCISDTMKYLKRKKRSPEQLISLDTLIGDGYLETVSQEDWVDNWVDLHFAVNQLTPPERQVLLLWSYGLPIKQIALITGLSYGHTRTLQIKAKKKLKAIFLNGGEQSE